MSEQLTDQVLVERVQKGDQKAFNLLVVRYQHKVASLVSRYVPPGDIADVVQESFVKAWRALDSFRGDSAFYTWLYRIAVNTAKNYLVAQGRRPPSSDVDANEAENFESGGALKEISNPENLMLSEELRQIVFRTIESLPEDLRMIAEYWKRVSGMQKEKLSALMDGETLDNELLNELSRSSEMQKTWESYHLIRDTLRGDTAEMLQFDISARVMAAIENEPARQVAPLIPESQPAPHQWRQMPFWQKVRPWASSLTQMGVAACVSLAVIVGVQQYNGHSDASQQPEAPVFNTMPMMGKASPVSLGVPADASAGSGQQAQVQEQRRRINAMLQDYELQRRLHAEQLQFGQAQTQQAAVQVPGYQTLGTQSQ